ncbi:MAG: hypothetical protein WCO93_11670 [bacterium]
MEELTMDRDEIATLAGCVEAILKGSGAGTDSIYNASYKHHKSISKLRKEKSYVE